MTDKKKENIRRRTINREEIGYMKKAKSVQRIWAFLLAFVLTATTIGSDGLTITAAEGEEAAVETIEVSEETEANLSSTEDNIAEGSGENEAEPSQPESTEAKGDSVQEVDKNTESPAVETNEENSGAAFEESTETITEESTETLSEESTETVSAETQAEKVESENSTWTVSFHKEGSVLIKDASGNEIDETAAVEKGSEISFFVEADEDESFTVKAEGNIITSDNGCYKVKPESDITIEVIAVEKETIQEEDKPAIIMFRMLKAPASEMAKVTYHFNGGEGPESTVNQIPLGAIADNAPDYEGYSFINATIGNTEIVFVGIYEGIYYYSVDGESALELGNSEIQLNYELEKQKYNISFVYDDKKGYIKGEKVITGDKGEKLSYTFTPVPNKDCEISEVTINGEKAAAQKDGTYTVAEVSEDLLIAVSFIEKKVFTITKKLSSNSENGTFTGNDNADYNGTWTGTIRTPDKNYELTYLLVNGVHINIPANNNTANTEIDGMAVAVSRSNAGYAYQYKISISNIKQDLDVEGHLRKTSAYEIALVQAEGVDVYYWNGSGLEKISPGSVVKFNYNSSGNKVAVFYAKTQPGYEPHFSSEGTGFKIIDNINKNNYSGKQQAINLGCTHEFHYTNNTDQKNRTVYLKAVPIEYRVFYDANGGNSSFDDKGNYTLVNGRNKIFVSTEVPARNNYVFAGWKLKGDSTGKIYSAKELVTLTADNISKLAADKVITFTAQWLPKNEAASYNVRHFVETAEGKYELKEEKTLIGKPEATAFAIPKNYEGYEVDYSVEGTVRAGKVLNDGSLTLALYYRLKDYQLSYNGNASGVSDVPSGSTYKGGSKVTVSSQIPVRKGYTFLGWSETAAGNVKYQAEDVFFMPYKNVALFAQWKRDEEATKKLNYQVVYQVEGGKVLDTVNKAVDIWVNADEYKVESVESKTFAGYKQKANSPKLPQTVKDNEKVYVLYEKNEEETKNLSYQVVYQVEGGNILDTVNKTVDIWVNADEYKVETVESKTFSGYKQKADSPKLPQIVKENDKVYVLYEKNEEETKNLSYQVVYQVEGGKVLDTVNKTVDIWVNADEYKVESVESKTFAGYKQKADSPKLPQIVKENDKVYVLYEKNEEETKNLSYQVVYQVEGGKVLDTVNKTVDIWVNADEYKVESVESKTFAGYKQKADSPKLPQTVKDTDKIYVLYEKNEEETKELHYQVVYQVEGGKVLDTVDKTVNIWINADDYEVETVESKTFTGYKQKTDSPKLPQTVKDKDKIYVLYEKNEEATKNLSYQVVYQVEGGKVLDTVNKTVDIWVNADEYKVETVESKTFSGYKQKADSPKLPQIVKDKDKIYVLYEKNEEETKELHYQVVYQVEGGKVLDTVNKTVDIWVNADEYKVESVESKTFAGYKQKADSPKLPQIVKDKDKIYVLYEKNEEETKELSYQVVYQVEGGKVLDTVNKTVDIWVNADEYKVESVESKPFAGYKQKADSPKLPQTVKDTDKIYVLYEKNEEETKELHYQVVYQVEGGKVLDTVDKTVNIWINADDYEVETVESKTFTGYKQKTDSPKLPQTVKDKDKIYVLYEKNEETTKNLSYQVVYQVEGGNILDTVNKTVDIWVNADEYKVETVESKTFSGYKQKADSPKLPQTVKENDKVYVLYEKNEEATKNLSYQVVYQVEGGKVLDTVNKTVDIWVNADEYKVESVESKTFAGYKKKADSPKLPQTVKDDDKIYVLYEKNEEATKNLSYQVIYKVEGGEVLDTVDKTVSIWINADNYEVTSVESKSFTGYKQKSDSPKLPQTVKENDKIYVLYEKNEEATKNLSYQVVYKVEGGEVLDTVDKTVSIWINADDYEVTSVESKTFTGYTQKSDSPKLPQTVKTGDIVYVYYTENTITITYNADANGTVSNAGEALNAVTGVAKGSEAAADNGYHFVNWTNEAGEVVSTDAAFVPAKIDGMNVEAAYTAHFAANPVTPPDNPTPDNPTPGDQTTGDQTPGTTPEPTTSVLGEAYAPVQPEISVLGEAAAPDSGAEVGVLGERKGPGTGDTAPIAGWAFIIAGAILTLALSAKKRRNEDK